MSNGPFGGQLKCIWKHRLWKIIKKISAVGATGIWLVDAKTPPSPRKIGVLGLARSQKFATCAQLWK